MPQQTVPPWAAPAPPGGPGSSTTPAGPQAAGRTARTTWVRAQGGARPPRADRWPGGRADHRVRFKYVINSVTEWMPGGSARVAEEGRQAGPSTSTSCRPSTAPSPVGACASNGSRATPVIRSTNRPTGWPTAAAAYQAGRVPDAGPGFGDRVVPSPVRRHREQSVSPRVPPLLDHRSPRHVVVSGSAARRVDAVIFDWGGTPDPVARRRPARAVAGLRPRDPRAPAR